MTDDKQVIKHVMIDILNLKHGLEDNLLLIKQLRFHLEEENRKEIVVNAARQHITSISTVYQLGTAWLKSNPNPPPLVDPRFNVPGQNYGFQDSRVQYPPVPGANPDDVKVYLIMFFLLKIKHLVGITFSLQTFQGIMLYKILLPFARGS